MQFKEGLGWKACYDEQTGLYTAQRSWRGDYHLYEITKEIFDKLDNHGEDEYPDGLIRQGRELYESHDSGYGPSYNIVHDEDYAKLCAWTEIQETTDHTFPQEVTKAAKEVMQQLYPSKDEQ